MIYIILYVQAVFIHFGLEKWILDLQYLFILTCVLNVVHHVTIVAWEILTYGNTRCREFFFNYADPLASFDLFTPPYLAWADFECYVIQPDNTSNDVESGS